jgi:hypothetical protein
MNNTANSQPTARSKLAACDGMVRRRVRDLYATEKIEAYNVAIEALLGHEPADGDPTGIARKLRRALAAKLDREIQKWCDARGVA